MEVYNSEDEQLEAIKKWLKENGRSIIGGIAIGLIAIAGWRIWQNQTVAKAQEASHLYQQLLVANTEDQPDSVTTIADQLETNYSSTIYAVYAKLIKAKTLVKKKDLDGARQALQSVVDSSTDPNFKHIARIRLGRLMLAADEIEQGLQLLDPVDIPLTGKFAGLYEELKGDLYMKLNREDDARTAYQKASMSGGANPAIIQIKLDQVAAPPLSETPPTQ